MQLTTKRISRKDQLHPVDEHIMSIWNTAVEYSCAVFIPGQKTVSVRVKPPMENVLDTAKHLVVPGVRSVLIYAMDQYDRGALVATISSDKVVKMTQLKKKKK